MKLTEIIFLNDVIRKHRSGGAKVQMIIVSCLAKLAWSVLGHFSQHLNFKISVLILITYPVPSPLFGIYAQVLRIYSEIEALYVSLMSL